MDFGVTDQGFNLKRLEDIKGDLETWWTNAKFIDENGEVVTSPNLLPESVNGQIIGIMSAALAQIWELAQLANNQWSPGLARSNNLSALVQLNKLQRKEATASTVTLTLTGTNGTVVPAGSQVRDTNQTITVALDSDTTIGVSGTIDASATAIDTGPLSAAIGVLTVIVNPVTGWSSVTNAAAATPGRDTESDEGLRRRRVDSTFRGQGNNEAVFAEVANIDEVEFVRVYVNSTLTTDSRGIPGKEITIVVVGGDNTEIAQAYDRTVGADNVGYGNTQVILTTDQGYPREVNFIRPDPVDIYVSVTVTAGDNFPEDGDDRIKQAIVDYAAGGADALGWDDGGNQDGFPPGDDVILSRLYTPINSVPDHTVTDLQIGFSVPGLGTSNLTINYDEVSAWDVDNITVTVN